MQSEQSIQKVYFGISDTLKKGALHSSNLEYY